MGSSHVLSIVNLSHCGQVLVKPAYHHLAPRFRKVMLQDVLLETVGAGELEFLRQDGVFSAAGKEHEGSLLSSYKRALPLELQI